MGEKLTLLDDIKYHVGVKKLKLNPGINDNGDSDDILVLSSGRSPHDDKEI